MIAAPTLLARRTFDEKSSRLINVNFAPDEPFIVLVRENGVVQRWDLENNEISSFFIGRPFRKASPICCAILARNFIATGHKNGEVRLHGLDGKEARQPSSHLGGVLSLAKTPTHLLSGGSDGVIWATALDGRKAKSRAWLEGLGAMTTFAVSPDAASIAVGCDDGTVGLWRAGAGDAPPTLDWTRSGHASPVEFLAFSPNGAMLVSRAKDNGLRLWAAQTSYELPLAERARGSHVAPTFSGDNRYLAVAGARNSVEIFDIATEKSIYALPSSGETVRHLAFATASDATRLAVAGEREIALWRI